jgi:hypothetical protein
VGGCLIKTNDGHKAIAQRITSQIDARYSLVLTWSAFICARMPLLVLISIARA